MRQVQVEQPLLLTLVLLQRSLLEKMLLYKTAVVRNRLHLILVYLQALLALKARRDKMVLQSKDKRDKTVLQSKVRRVRQDLMALQSKDKKERLVHKVLLLLFPSEPQQQEARGQTLR